MMNIEFRTMQDGRRHQRSVVSPEGSKENQ